MSLDGGNQIVPPSAVRRDRAELPTVVKRGKFWRFYVLKRVFLQRATHLGTQTEYLLAKHPENDPLDTNAT